MAGRSAVGAPLDRDHAGGGLAAGRVDDLPAQGSGLSAGAGLGVCRDLGEAWEYAAGGNHGPGNGYCAGCAGAGTVDRGGGDAEGVRGWGRSSRDSGGGGREWAYLYEEIFEQVYILHRGG